MRWQATPGDRWQTSDVNGRKDDGSFIVHGIPKAGKVLDDFWNAALSEDKVSARFMKDADATVETVDGKDIVVICMPCYCERRGIVCVWGDDAITIANPGDFRLPIEEARKPGASDPRNETMLKIFSFVNVGERAGSGMGTIENGWTAGGYAAPSYEVAYGPDRTTLTLPLVSAEKKSAEIG